MSPLNAPIGKVLTMGISRQPIETLLMSMLSCYQLHFPQPSLLLRKQGTYPSVFTMRQARRTGMQVFRLTSSLWALTSPPASSTEVLLRARAIEYQYHFLAPAQLGERLPGSSPTSDSTSRPFHGYHMRAMTIDPWGTVLAKCVDDPAGQHENGAFCVAE